MEETTTLSGGTDGDAAPTGTQASSSDPDIVDTDYSDDIKDDFGKPPTVEVDTANFGSQSCDSNVCRNGGTCISTLTGPKCHCPLQYTGRQCEEELDVETPGFLGHSLLVHE